MGNLGGAEVLVILLVALIVLGPTKLPPAIRQIGRVVGEFRRIGQGFQQELREAAQPLQETKETLKAADKEFREVSQKPIEEMKDTLKAADKELRDAAEEPVEEKGATSKGADKEPSEDRTESSPDEPDSGSEHAA